MSNLVRHPHHLVDESPWPILGALGALLSATGGAALFSGHGSQILITGILSLFMASGQWWMDIANEGTMQGHHSKNVELGLRWGMILFITSEVLFFVSFFWAFFHASLSPSEMVGGEWPPVGIMPFNCFKVPLLNTIILLASGVSVTWAHHSLMESAHNQAALGLMTTVLLGGYFTLIQGLEYKEATFSMADSSYGSTFFMATGFHGLHVLVGSLFLAVCLTRLVKCAFSGTHHFGFEAASWYWHFVDVVWLFLYVMLYWWSAN